MKKIFTLENGLLVLDKDELRLIPEFRKILERDRGSKADAQGRLKLQANKEFHYIYGIADFRSPGNQNGLGGKDLINFARKEAQLSDDWKDDEFIKKAIDRYYQELEDTPSIKIVGTLIRGLRLSNNAADLLINKISTNVDKLTEKIENPNLTDDERLVVDNAIGSLITNVKQLISLSADIPKAIDALKIAEDKVKIELSESNSIRGGHKKANRMDPKAR